MQENVSCVVVVDEALPAGVQANTAAILGMTLGSRRPDVVGEDVRDASGTTHAGIVTVPVPVLRCDGAQLRALRSALRAPDFEDVLTVDFSDVARACRTYAEYRGNAAATPEEAHTYLGLALCGPRKKVKRLTGSLPLLR